jgi:hypothetical protein
MTNVVPSQFADDIGIRTTCLDPMEANASLQASLTLIEAWFSRWQIMLSPSKSKVVLFSQFPTDKGSTISLNLFGKNLGVCKEAMFLWVLFAARLTWEPEFQRLVEKSSKSINLLRSISGHCSKPNPNFMVGIYRALTLPILEYGCIVAWFFFSFKSFWLWFIASLRQKLNKTTGSRKKSCYEVAWTIR